MNLFTLKVSNGTVRLDSSPLHRPRSVVGDRDDSTVAPQVGRPLARRRRSTNFDAEVRTRPHARRAATAPHLTDAELTVLRWLPADMSIRGADDLEPAPVRHTPAPAPR
ncbi:hypothetical protein [Nocardia sp. NPDC051833]|uniref:hypothetical protein n=1 Tax=Nocardia sp. NPDC051833 TaxID=3155674 RepID=UPI0034348352